MLHVKYAKVFSYNTNFTSHSQHELYYRSITEETDQLGENVVTWCKNNVTTDFIK